jgi:ketosteroid isomerase-like protein
MTARIALIVLLALATPANAAPLGANDTLTRAIAAADAALFDASNHCDLDTFARYVADDLEFYHDKSGLSVGKADLLQKTKENICGKIVRELVPGSLEVYPLPGFGAIEIGTHRFLHPKEPGNIGEARFIHVWRQRNAEWLLSRVISYDH